MPKTNPQSPKRSPMAIGNYRRAELAQLTAARNKGLKHSSSKKANTTSSLNNTNRKRKPSFSSVSTISSFSGFEEDDQDEADSEASSDEDDESAHRTPSYGGKSRRGRKTGSKTKSSPLSIKKRKLSYDEGYDGQQSSAGDSDSDYAAVDEISDDDEDFDVEKLEEQMILDSEDENDKVDSIFSTSDAPNVDEWAGFGSFDDHVLFSTEPLLEDHLYSAMETFGETDFTSEAVETPVQRHVHFVVEDDDADSDSSSDSRDGSTDDEIPGDFLQQDSLDPTLRRMIDNDYDAGSNQRQEDIFGESDFSHPANIYHVESDAVSDGSSGYETDDGETTDEDLPPPATITHPRSILRRDSTTSLTATGDSTSQRSNPPRRRGPIMGTFVADPKKPVALVDCTGKHLVIIPAYASSRHDWLESATNSMCGTAHNSPRATTMHLVDESDTDALTSPNGFELNPMLSSGNLMMTALGNDATPGGQVMGPPEAFYPSQTFGGDSSYDEDDDEDDERMLNVDDFIDFGNGSSDDEEEEEEEEEETMNKASDDEEGLLTSPAVATSVQALNTPTPNRVNNSDNAERFLNHLDKGIVTAFRRNHARYQTLIRLPQHREFMPANSPSRVASVFKHSRYTDPRTPPRKRKASQYTGGEAVRRKLVDGHHRNQLSF